MTLTWPVARVDRLFGLHFAGDVVEHAVAHVDGVVEPDEASPRPDGSAVEQVAGDGLDPVRRQHLANRRIG